MIQRPNVCGDLQGGFSGSEENYKKRVGDIIPHRLKYKKLVRG